MTVMSVILGCDFVIVINEILVVRIVVSVIIVVVMGLGITIFKDI